MASLAMQEYMQMVTAPFLLTWSVIILVPSTAFPFRLFFQMLIFIFARDAMIPTGLWTITRDMQMKFTSDAPALIIIALLSLFCACLMYMVNKTYTPVTLFRSTPLISVCAGVIISLVICFPVYLLRKLQAADQLQSNLGVGLILANLGICLAGNLTEEILYRSFLASYFKGIGISATRSMLLQASTFAVCHIYLAFVLTKTGIPIIVFTFYEGLLCAYLEHWHGLVSSALAHGLAIFFISILL